MKKLLLLLSLVGILFSCNSGPTLYEKRQASLATGIVVDTTMFAVCFNDNPAVVKMKLGESGHTGLYGFCYQFPEERIHDLEWKWSSFNSFYNDSLYSFSLHAKSYYNPIEVLKEIFSLKYGETYENNGKFYWYKGNLEISISYDGSSKKTKIEYLNLSNDGYNQSRFQSDEECNWYSEEYWEQNKQPKIDEAIKVAGSDI